MHILGSARITTRNHLGYILNQGVEEGIFAVAIYPEGIVVDPSSKRKGKVVIYGGKKFDGHRKTVTAAQLVDPLVAAASGFSAKVFVMRKYLVCIVEKCGIVARNRIRLKNGKIDWASVLGKIAAAIKSAIGRYALKIAKIVQMCSCRKQCLAAGKDAIMAGCEGKRDFLFQPFFYTTGLTRLMDLIYIII